MVAAVVIDNSGLLPLFIPDESAAIMQRALALADHNGTYLLSPNLCLIEFGNGIVTCVRRKRITAEGAVFAYRRLPELPIEFVDNETAQNLPVIHDLAMRHSLSFYDALYLALAIEKNALLATQDKALHQAAEREGIAFA